MITRLAVPLLALAAPAGAEQFFLPAGCEAFLTIQGRSCTVEHHFTCASDPEGHKRRVEMDEQGLTFSATIDTEGQWIESFHILAGYSESLAPDPVDPASLTELFATQSDSYNFQTFSTEVGATRYVGRDRLTGNAVLIDGVTLLETAFDLRAFNANGTEMWHYVGSEFVSEDWRMFLSGTGRVTTSDETYDLDDTPVDFIFPGEPGFLSSQPEYGCSQMMTKREIAQ
jgi:hypothetical protein